MRPNGIVTLLTDFGQRDAYAGIMKGAVLSICPRAQLIDLTHDVPPQAVPIGALALRSAVPYFPDGTVHVAVVDPGVGSTRAAVVVATARAYLVGPDNGLLVPAAAQLGIEAVYRLERAEYFRQPVSATFHGRDVFAPVAAHLANGVAPDAFGPPLPALVPLPLPEPACAAGVVRGVVVYVDRFGNLVSNIPAAALAAFHASGVSVTIAAMTLSPIAPSYAAVAPGAPLALIGSWDTVEIAVRDGNAAEHFGVGIGAPVTLTET
jgi:S-adenosylmethionine hydrolase